MTTSQDLCANKAGLVNDIITRTPDITTFKRTTLKLPTCDGGHDISFVSRKTSDNNVQVPCNYLLCACMTESLQMLLINVCH